MNNNILETETTKRRVFHARVQTNKEGLIDQISPIYGLKSIADKSDMDFVIDLVPFDQPISESKVDYSTDHFSDDQIPSIMEEAFRNIDTAASEERTPTDKLTKASYHASMDRQALRMQEEAFKADQQAPDAEEEADREAYERWLEDRKADAAQGFETPKSSPEKDFWDEPDFLKTNVVPFEDPSTEKGTFYTTVETSEIIFGHSELSAMKKMYQKSLRKTLKVSQAGKGCAMLWPKNAVDAYKAKLVKRCGGSEGFLPTHSLRNKKLDA